jgi:hypothetical protein
LRLGRTPNQDPPRWAPRDSSFEKDEILVFFDIHDFDVLKSHLPVPVLPRHLQALKGMMRIGGGTDGPSMTKIFVGSMRPGRAVKPVAFDHACKPFSLAETRDIHYISGFKETRIDFLT